MLSAGLVAHVPWSGGTQAEQGPATNSTWLPSSPRALAFRWPTWEAGGLMATWRMLWIRHESSAHPTLPLPLATPQPCSTLTAREGGQLHLDVHPGGKGSGFGKELVNFCYQYLQND